MLIKTYADALAAIGTRAADIEVPDFDRTIKPTDYLRAPVGNCVVEGLILARQEHIHFE